MMMKKLFITPRPDLVRQPRLEGRSRRSSTRRRSRSRWCSARRSSGWSSAIAIGVVAAAMRGTFVDPLLMILGLIGISMPVFWLGEVMNLLTQSRLHDSSCSPGCRRSATSRSRRSRRAGSCTWSSRGSRSRCSTSASTAACCASSLLEAQNEDYVRTARAKGLTERRILLRHALRTSLITFVTLFGLDFGALVGGGALLTEVVFGLPGVGKLTYDALQNLDLPVIMATVMYAVVLRRPRQRASSTSSTPARPAGARWLTRRCSRCATCASRSAPRTGSCAPSTACRSRVDAGEVLGIVGESGSGKSVTVLSIMRLIRDPNAIIEGEVLLQGPRPARARRRARCASVRGARDRDDLPGPDDRADPVYTRRLADRRADPRARAALEAAGARSARSSCCARSASPSPSGASTTTRTSSRAACASAR